MARARIIAAGPTGSGQLVAVLGGAIAGWGLLQGTPRLLALGLAVAAVPLASYLVARLALARVIHGISRTVSGQPVEGSIMVVRLTATGMPLPVAAVIEDRPPLGVEAWGKGGRLVLPLAGDAWIDYEVKARPGRRRFGPARLRLRDPLGLYEVEAEVTPRGADSLSASPRPEPPPRELLGQALEAVVTTARAARGPGTEFYSVREYVEGDEPRLIEWKATARLGKLMVKDLRRESLAPTIIIVAPGPGGDEGPPGETPFERLARAMAGLAVDLAARGVPVGYVSGVDGDEVVEYPRQGPSAVEAVLDGLARTSPAGPLDPGLGEVSRRIIQGFVQGVPVIVLASGDPGTGEEALSMIRESLGDLRAHIAHVTVVDGEVKVAWLGASGWRRG